MERHEALQDLSRDHHHALVWAKRLTESASGEAAERPRDTAEAFLAFWDAELAEHFTEEEHVLLPVYQRHLDLAEDGLVLEMLADHAWFRDTVSELRQRLAYEEPVGDLVADLGQRLHDHARMEDRELFPRIEETLDEDELTEMHERSKAFRREHRGEDAIGSR